jgi:hypothetical protein
MVKVVLDVENVQNDLQRVDFETKKIERLAIENFANIKEADIEIKPFTIIIGEQRNELSKLIHFLRELLLNPANAANSTKLFKSYFKTYFSDYKQLDVSYKVEGAEITVWTDDDEIKVEINKSKSIRGMLYIPVERNSPLRFPSVLFETKNRFMIIEDIDLHLFPRKHKEAVFYISEIHNRLNNFVVVTANSPYVLSAVNILLLSGNVMVMNENNKVKDEIERLIGKDTALKFENIGAYEIDDGKVKSFLNYENKLLDTNIIDKVAEEHEELFDRIIEIDLYKK